MGYIGVITHLLTSWDIQVGAKRWGGVKWRRGSPPKSNKSPLKINDWKMTCPFEMVPFLGDVRYFSEGVGHFVKGESEVTNPDKNYLSKSIFLTFQFSTLNSHPPPQKRETLNLKNASTIKIFSSWWLNQPLWKILVKMDIFPNFRGEKKKYLSCHHRVLCFPNHALLFGALLWVAPNNASPPAWRVACQDVPKVQQNGWLQLHPKLPRWWGWPENPWRVAMEVKRLVG